MKRTIKELRALAKEHGVNSFGKSADVLEKMLFEAGVLESSSRKGGRSWKPGNLLDLIDKEPGYRYRMCLNDPANIRKKLNEGWQFVNNVTDPGTKHVKPDRIGDGAELGNVGYRELIVMRLPEEMGKARDEYHKEITEGRQRGLRAMTQKRMKEAAGELGAHEAPVHGDGITIIK